MYWHCRLFLLSLFYFCSNLTNSEVFTSVQHLNKAFQFERNVVQALSSYVKKTEQNLDKIKGYLQNYQQVNDEAKLLEQNGNISKDSQLEIAEKLAGNPLQVYQLMKRLAIEWKKLLEQNHITGWDEVLSAIDTENDLNLSSLSDEEELKGTAQGIIILQTYYKLNVTNLVRGDIDGIQTASKLTAEDCLYLGNFAYNHSKLTSSAFWFEKAYELSMMEEKKTTSTDIIRQSLNKVYEKFFEMEGPINVTSFFSKEMSLITDLLTEDSKLKFKDGEFLCHNDINRNFEALCRGEQLLSDEYIAKLKCYYDNRNSPYLVLMPAKVEQMHIHPQIYIFHDVIRDKEIEKLKSYAEPLLSRGLVHSFEETGIEKKTSNSRTSKIAWMNYTHEIMEYDKMNAHIEALTGLITRKRLSAELLQIANYGTGGFYKSHTDFLLDPEIGAGNRIATFMFYLSDVKKGGGTAFPRLGVHLSPEKGSAAFWYNLKTSGIGDYFNDSWRLPCRSWIKMGC
ncbi:UNVERIFIED_CONTAM: hypothetical protein RMT77_002661 [Armadillidium vulgare]